MKTRKVSVLTALLGCLFVAILLIAAGRFLQDRQHSWRAIVRVRLQVETSRSSDPYLWHRLMNPSSPLNSSSGFGRQNPPTIGEPVGALKFLGIKQYRSTSLLELKFSARTKADALRLGMAAAQRWCDAAQAQEPAVTIQVVEGYTVSTLRDQWSAIRQWCWRHFGFWYAPLSITPIAGAWPGLASTTASVTVPA